MAVVVRAISVHVHWHCMQLLHVMAFIFDICSVVVSLACLQRTLVGSGG